MIEMKVFVEVGMYVEVEEPVFEDLHRIHASDENARGTDAQYDEAVAANSGRPALAGQDLDIIVRRFRAAPGFRSVELGAVQRHRIDVDLIGALKTAAPTVRACCRPRITAVICRPLVADIRAVLSRNREAADLGPITSAAFVELHLVYVACLI